MQSSKDHKNRVEAEQRQSPAGGIVYRAIYAEGKEELSRDSDALAWSGFAAGLAMGLSLLTEALLRAHLPDTFWRPAITKLGYGVGFLVVILGRQQLFTENTLTVILPLMRLKRAGILVNVLRLWGVVFAANIVGAILFAGAMSRLPVVDPAVKEAAMAIGREAMSHGFMTVLVRGVFAGWLIAMMVWLLPFAESGRIWVILIITYVVGLAGFAHVVAGSAEAFVLSWEGVEAWTTTLGRYMLPSLIGNTIGGVALVAAIAHVQYIEGTETQDL